jgi:hypothetical protein
MRHSTEGYRDPALVTWETALGRGPLLAERAMSPARNTIETIFAFDETYSVFRF